MKSFEDWCIENNRQDILERWDYELNLCSPKSIGYGCNSRKFWFKCPKNIHESEENLLNSITSNRCDFKCKKCNSFAQYGIDNFGNNFLNEYWDYNKNTINLWELSKGNKTKKIWIFCKKTDYHGSYETIAHSFYIGNACFFCSNNNEHPHKNDSLGYLFPKTMEIYSDKNKKSFYEYRPFSKRKVWFKCKNGKHKDYLARISDANKCDFRCPKCSEERDESVLQQKIKEFLNTYDYTILHEYDCTIIAQNPKVKNKTGRMPYDNEIKELNLIIECHGSQHYKISCFHIQQAKHNKTTKELEFNKQRIRDRYKKLYVRHMGYNYLEIPYWTDDKNETWKKIIIDKILELENG